ncbi:hypothetical protein GCM10027187_00890 [Streptosporangium sandarakinum]
MTEIMEVDTGEAGVLVRPPPSFGRTDRTVTPVYRARPDSTPVQTARASSIGHNRV